LFNSKLNGRKLGFNTPLSSIPRTQRRATASEVEARFRNISIISPAPLPTERIYQSQDVSKASQIIFIKKKPEKTFYPMSPNSKLPSNLLSNLMSSANHN